MPNVKFIVDGQEETSAVRFALKPYGDGVKLVAMTPGRAEQWYIALLLPGQPMTLCPALSADLGLPLDTDGCVLVGEASDTASAKAKG